MVDERFFKKRIESISLGEIQSIIGLPVEFFPDVDTNRQISSLSGLSDDLPNAISFFSNRKYKQDFAKTSIGYCFCRPGDIKFHNGLTVLVIVEDPYFAMAKLAMHFYSHVNTPELNEGENYNQIYFEKFGAFVDASASIAPDAKLGRGVVIGKNVSIGRGSVISHNCVISSGVVIGEDCAIWENTSIKYTTIGNNSIIHPGARIGQDGFGFAHNATTGEILKITHLGSVEIGNNVEIGANTTIDRGSFGTTRIGDYTKIDNLVQIAHNVEIGKGNFIASCTGIAGSAKIGNGCMIGGGSGINGHIEIGSGVVIAGKSGVVTDVQNGEKIGGFPAINLRDWHKSNALLRKMVKKNNNKD